MANGIENGRVRDNITDFSNYSSNFLFENNDNEIEINFEINEEQNELSIPISIFNNNYLSILEAVSKFLKENIGLKYCQIALMLNRNDRTIWSAYNNAKRKMNSDFLLYDSNYKVPLEIFRDRKLSVLEAVVEYLKDEFGLKFCKIAALLNRNDRTIWTVFQRAKKKRNNKKND
jgi:hypothetical protein